MVETPPLSQDGVALESAWSLSERFLKRCVDMLISVPLLVAFSPVVALAALLIWLEDLSNPVYAGVRIGKGGQPFRMYKLRSMVPNAERAGVDSTAADDPRITRVGAVVRKFKVDEFLQFANVVKGDMSLVGPRPQVSREVKTYTAEERRLLSVRPGLVDFATIVFADESAILADVEDPDIGYNRLIRPWKSRMALHYLDNRSVWLDVRLVLVVSLNAVSRRRALDWIASILKETGAERQLVEVAHRRRPLTAAPPPGADEIVTTRRVQNS